MNLDLQLSFTLAPVRGKITAEYVAKVVSKEGFGLDLGLFTAPLVYLN